jgi:hypothetical protein
MIYSEDMRSFFDPHVDRIIELIQDHILQIEDKGRTVAVCFFNILEAH